jgi:superfamily II DNA or RNA helicase
LFHTIIYGTELFNYLNSNCIGKHFYYIDGKTPKEKRDFIKKTMEETHSSEPKILLASYGCFSTGISIKAIMNVIFADSFKSDQIIRQSIGRGLRLHNEKSKLFVFDIVDKIYSKYNNILYKQYLSRKEKIYDVQQFPVQERIIKI